ncbi:MAG: type III pantothenate kinase [Bacteroidales bacterium]
MNLVVDIGNTGVKIATMDGNDIVELLVDASQTLEKGLAFLRNHQHIQQCIVSSVRNDDDATVCLLRQALPSALWFNTHTSLPIKNAYTSPSTLGPDRLAAAVGASCVFPQENVLIIDAGTALTYDLITADSTYLGGNISLGIDMRFNALHTFTQKLPLCQITSDVPLIGNDTQTAIVAGVLNGVLYEVEANLQQFALKYSNLKFIFTGGNVEFFVNHLKKTIFVNSNLVLIGLNRILNHYA